MPTPTDVLVEELFKAVKKFTEETGVYVEGVNFNLVSSQPLGSDREQYLTSRVELKFK